MGDITSNLILWGRNLEGSGTTVANSASGGLSGLTLTNGPTWGAGPYTNLPAVICDGSNDAVATTSAIDLTSYSALTLAMWVKITDNNQAAAILAELSANYNNVSTGLILYADTVSNAIHYGHKGDVGYSEFSTSFSDWGVWHHFAAVHDKTASTNEVTWYLDGTAQTRTAGAGNSNNTNAFANTTLYLMARNAGSLNNQCSFADFRLYGRALAAGDVTDLVAYTGVPIGAIASMGDDN